MLSSEKLFTSVDKFPSLLHLPEDGAQEAYRFGQDYRSAKNYELLKIDSIKECSAQSSTGARQLANWKLSYF